MFSELNHLQYGMINHKELFQCLLSCKEPLANELNSPQEQAKVFVEVCFLQIIFDFIIEQNWIYKKQNPRLDSGFKEFLEPRLNEELSIRPEIHEFLSGSSVKELKKLKASLHVLQNKLINNIIEHSFIYKKQFCLEALKQMTNLFLFENKLQIEKEKKNSFLGLSLYRAFDDLDQIFGLNYDNDFQMKQSILQKERIYEGAGAGVQSGYSTLLTALQELKPPLGSRVVDLGSGYGRLGLIIGLLRPDILFQGFEYVQHRVELSEKIAQDFEIGKNVHFSAQDLSHENFKIPDSDYYYLYDPFSNETYKYILDQLIEISRNHKITIVTKGNARFWLNDISKSENWPQAQEFHNGNLCFYKTAD